MAWISFSVPTLITRSADNAGVVHATVAAIRPASHQPHLRIPSFMRRSHPRFASKPTHEDRYQQGMCHHSNGVDRASANYECLSAHSIGAALECLHYAGAALAM